MTEMFEKLMNEGLEEISLTLSEQQKEQFFRYYEMLIEWNKVMNLTAITELDEVVTKHFMDSLLLVKVIADIQEKPYKCIDVGTGAGFPGMVLKIVYPDISVVLLDSLAKRLRFLEELGNELNLQDISYVHARTEDAAMQKVYREKFDIVVSRAVAQMNILSEYCLPYTKVGGCFVAYKGGDAAIEVTSAFHAIQVLGGAFEKIETFPFYDMQRSLVFIRKKNPTPRRYPRKAGVPSKSPL